MGEIRLWFAPCGSAQMLVLAATAPAARAEGLVCPAVLRAGIATGFELVGKLQGSAGFETLNIVEGEPGDEAKYAPAALVPDVTTGLHKDRTATWDLTPPHEQPLLMVCWPVSGREPGGALGIDPILAPIACGGSGTSISTCCSMFD